MAAIEGYKSQIVKTRDSSNYDWVYTDRWPTAINGQRKMAKFGKSKMLTTFYSPLARIGVAISGNEGKEWRVQEDIFKGLVMPHMDRCLNPCVVTDKHGVIHMAFRAFDLNYPSYYTQIFYSRSKDGIGWEEPIMFPADPENLEPKGIPCIGVGDKDEVYISFEINGDLYLERSFDSGNSWYPNPKLIYPNPFIPDQVSIQQSMAVAKDGIIYIAFRRYGEIHCVKGAHGGDIWERKVIFGEDRFGGETPCVATSADQKPVVAIAVYMKDSQDGPHKSMRVIRQNKNFNDAWFEETVDSVLDDHVQMYSPSISVCENDTNYIAYTRNTDIPNVSSDKWSREIYCAEKKAGDKWDKPFPITQSYGVMISPQCWPNLYWNSRNPPKNQFLAVWDGKKEDQKTYGGDWFANSFRSIDFKS